MRTDPHVEHELDLVLEKKEILADRVVLLTLRRADGGDLPEWGPGAHIDLVLRDDLIRQYSLCGDPAERSVFQVAVLREVDGRGGSEHVHDMLTAGDPVSARGPRNHFRLSSARRYIFIAGGIGITPILPMVAAAESADVDWHLFYGGRSRRGMAFHDVVSNRYPGKVTIHPLDEVGLLDLAAILARPGATPEDVAVYCCGPEPLLDAVEGACAQWPAGALHLERFTAKAGAMDAPRSAFEVELAASNKIVTVPADRSILDVVREAGIHVLSSCQGGTCGTCEVEVLDGSPDHRDSVLSPEERAAEDSMMICVSRSLSPRLVLDI